MAQPPSGAQFELTSGRQRATIVEVGGGIREYFDGDRAVLEPYAVGDLCDGAHGAVLAPWPNRLADGRYSFDGAERQLALTEPGKGNAIHGLLRWRPWRALEQGPERVLVAARIHPEPGYPFDLEVRVEYGLGPEGLTVTSTARNLGETPCPYGTGQHPYLSPGSGKIDDCRLELPAETLITTDSERGLPNGRQPVAGGPLDFFVSRGLGSSVIDSPFTDLRRDTVGRARARLSAPDGATVELWVDESYPYLEVFTGDTLAPARRRHGLGLEPMSCPPNAFQSGESLVRLEPGASHVAQWGVGLSR
jgi:aldose 1-epimerase